MVRSILSLLFSSLFLLTQSQEKICLLSWNLRLDLPADGDNAWPNRKEMVRDLILFHQADIVCSQEGLHHQLVYLQEELKNFSYLGVGRDDGKTQGEYTAIFYNTGRFSLLEKGNFWLSETPDTVSKGWDAAIVRICTWGILQDKKSRKKLLVLNTHFDHMGELARQESAKLILKKIQIINTENLPVILAGDFNATPTSKSYSILTEKLADARHYPSLQSYGPEATFNGFRFDQKPTERIDYFFINALIKVCRYGVLTDSRDLHYPSDHFPVLMEILL